MRVRTPMHWLIRRREQITALSSLAIAVCALYVAWETANISQTHNAVSTRPILLFGIVNLPMEKEIYFEVKNAGLGPAIITNFELYKDGEPLMPFPSHALSMLTALDIRHEGFVYQNIRPPLTIGPGQNVLMLSLPKEIYDPLVAQAFRSGSGRITAIACYCGLYEDQCYFSGTAKIPADSCATRPQYNPLKGLVGETPKGKPRP